MFKKKNSDSYWKFTGFIVVYGVLAGFVSFTGEAKALVPSLQPSSLCKQLFLKWWNLLLLQRVSF